MAETINNPPATPSLRAETIAAIEVRRAREAAALRANLARRKQQQRARAEHTNAAAAQDDPPCR
jgi:hypothetical protein